MFLELAIQKRGCKSVQTSLFCCLRRCLKTERIAVPATVILPPGYDAEEGLHVVIVRPNYRQPFPIRIGCQGLGAATILQIGMDIGIEEKPCYFMIHLPQDAKGIDRAGTAT